MTDTAGYTARTMMNTVMSTFFAGDYAGVTHAGLCLVALDTGNVLLAQRSMDETDAPDVQETYEFPGGGLEAGEQPYPGALREFSEEVGPILPEDARVVSGWRSENGVYQGFIVSTGAQFDLSDWTPTDETQAVAWVDQSEAQSMNLRPEMADFDWSLVDEVQLGVSGNEDVSMAGENDLSGVKDLTSAPPVLTMSDLATGPIPIHGVVAPENTESGDARAFNDGSMTSRPLRLPFSWQKISMQGHDGSIVIGSVDRLMRGTDGMIHWEGSLMCGTEEAEEFLDLLVFFGQFGVSVDGDKGSLDEAKTEATSVVWFDAVRMAGLTAVAIPAFAEAYVALGPHPDMPEAGSDAEVALVASGMQFGRGPGWVTNPEDTKRLWEYWTKPGQPGFEKIGWGKGGDFNRCVAQVGEEVGESDPAKLRFIKAQCAQWHHDALGYWPATHKKMIDKGLSAGLDEGLDDTDFAEQEYGAEKYPAADRKKMADEGTALPDGSFPIADVEDLHNAIQAIGRAKDPAAAKAHIKKRAAALGAESVLPESWSVLEMDDEGMGWEAVLVSSASSPKVSASYFDRHPDTGATVVEDPDANGYRRTYGYAAEWGVCHIGYDGKCVGVPADPTGGDYPEFHLGRTNTDDGYINTGLITYKIVHRDAKAILSQSAEQAHYDNIANAWAAVVLGEDDRGVWFSGVVLPHVPDEDVTLIEASGQVSGEWKYGALRGLQSVNIPGFPVMRSSAEYDDSGEVIALVASAHGLSDCEPSPAEMMAALAQADAEVRFAMLKSQWEG